MALLIAIWGFMKIEGLYVNSTNSYPIGLYQKTNDPIKTGSLVIFCPPEKEYFKLAMKRGYINAGFCSSGFEYMIKKVVAGKNDKVKFSTSGVYVNDNLLANSQPLRKDKSGRDLSVIKEQEFIINDNSVLLMSDYNDDSFDGRYFGLVDKLTIISSIYPILVWN